MSPEAVLMAILGTVVLIATVVTYFRTPKRSTRR